MWHRREQLRRLGPSRTIGRCHGNCKQNLAVTGDLTQNRHTGVLFLKSCNAKM